MQISKIEYKDFSFWKNKILDLLSDSAKINFSNENTSYARERCLRLESYLHEKQAYVFIATDGNELMGWIWCHEIKRLDEKRLHIAEIAVCKEYRNRGVGTELLNTAELFAKKKEYKAIDLLVTANNIEAISFYEKSSFSTERKMMKKNLF